MNCMFIFKSKKPKSKENNKGTRRRRELLPNSASELTTTRRRNQTTSLSFNLPTPRSLPSPMSIRDLHRERDENMRVFTYKELSDATCGFRRKFKIGVGGFGSVYKATIDNPTGGDSHSLPLTVVVKKLDRQSLQIIMRLKDTLVHRVLCSTAHQINSHISFDLDLSRSHQTVGDELALIRHDRSEDRALSRSFCYSPSKFIGSSYLKRDHQSPVSVLHDFNDVVK